MQFISEPKNLEPKYFVIKQDVNIGFYLFVFIGKDCIEDYLQDSFELAVEQAYEDYGVPKDSWKITNAL